jgi:hypothetical protein
MRRHPLPALVCLAPRPWATARASSLNARWPSAALVRGEPRSSHPGTFAVPTQPPGLEDFPLWADALNKRPRSRLRADLLSRRLHRSRDRLARVLPGVHVTID